MSKHPTVILSEDLDRFYQDISSLLNTIPIVMAVINVFRQSSYREFQEFLKQHGTEKEIFEDMIRYQVDVEHLTRSKVLNEKSNDFKNAYKLIPRHYIISLVSQFDSLLGRIVRFIYSVKPQMLNVSQKSFSYAEIVDFPDIASIAEYIIEKEIETVLRMSHAEQFDWLERTLQTPFNKNLKSWPEFIELTERRNLFVHTDGIVTSQYLHVCKNHNCVITEDLKVGDQLEVDSDYFERAFRCICEIGIKLAHVIWRRLSKDTLEEADGHLIVFTFDLISKGMYSIAIEILDHFTREEIKSCNEESRRILIVNKAQAYKWSGKEDQCKEILRELDWTVCEDKFKIAISALRDDFEECYRLMRRLKHDDKFRKTFYKDWPIFKRLRDEVNFPLVYEECYSEKFSIDQSQETKLEISMKTKKNH